MFAKLAFLLLAAVSAPGLARAAPVFQEISRDGGTWATLGPQGTAAWREYRKNRQTLSPPYPEVRGLAAGTGSLDEVRYEDVRHGCEPLPLCTFTAPGMFVLAGGPRLRSPSAAELELVAVEDARGDNRFDVRFGFMENRGAAPGLTLEEAFAQRALADMDAYYGGWGVDGLYLQLLLDNHLPTWTFVLNGAVLEPAESVEDQGARTDYRSEVSFNAPSFERDGGNFFSGTFHDTGLSSSEPLPLAWSITDTSPTTMQVQVGTAILTWVLDDGAARHHLTEPGNPDAVPYRDGTLAVPELVPVLYSGMGIERTPSFAPSSALVQGLRGTTPVLALGEAFNGHADAVVTVLDARGNVAEDFQGTVALTASDPATVLPEEHTFVPADRGVHRFPVLFVHGGEQTVSAHDTSLPALASSDRTVVRTGHLAVGCGCNSGGLAGTETFGAMALLLWLRARRLHEGAPPASVGKGP